MRLIAISGLISSVLASSAVPQTIPASPLQRAFPDYPSAGVGPNPTGSVTVEYAITAQGQVADAKVRKSDPPGVFDATALAAVRAWSFKPAITAGKAVDQPGNAVMLRFVPPEGPTASVIFRPTPTFPREAVERRLSGWVKLRFDVTPKGEANHIGVLDSSPAGVFDGAAIANLRQWLFAPPGENGRSNGVSGVTETIRFDSDTAQIAPRAIQTAPPVYPQLASAGKITGYVVVGYHIADDGKVDRATVKASSQPYLFDQPALNAVRNWRYEPPTADPCKCVATDREYLFKFAM